jgi:hypothetical protein
MKTIGIFLGSWPFDLSKKTNNNYEIVQLFVALLRIKSLQKYILRENVTLLFLLFSFYKANLLISNGCENLAVGFLNTIPIIILKKSKASPVTGPGGP